eukprot:CAMPEP_0204260192 /NCGR_PEP_ID=MMETSP0468-20130131/6162_1 /ASSEMBLY_ACC=CAM_ASM_000383 /TAXON_ID=2969 /ORGANISM="Oxyrrhis marina" /LENGTH=290 /DNA_ID=CAMNT_0051234585 /DNA_START=58 /DNA_END=929 /DNA_ORIENTATION=+
MIHSAFLEGMEPGFMDSRRPFVQLTTLDGETRQTMYGEWSSATNRWFWEEPLACEIGLEDNLHLAVHSRSGYDMLAFEFVASTLLFGEVNVPMGHVWRRLRCDDRAMWSTGPLTFDIISHARRIGQITLTFESTVGPAELAPSKFLGCGFVPPEVESGDTDRTALGCPVFAWSKRSRYVEGSDDDEDSSTESYSEKGNRDPALYLPPPTKEVMPPEAAAHGVADATGIQGGPGDAGHYQIGSAVSQDQHGPTDCVVALVLVRFFIGSTRVLPSGLGSVQVLRVQVVASQL